MSKKDDLKVVFDFIAEYLKEEQPKIETKKELLVENKEPEVLLTDVNDVLFKMKKPIENVGADAAHIKQLMDRIDAKTAEQASVNNLLAIQRREFEQEIKKLKDKVSEEFIAEKISEENTNNELSVVGENNSEPNVVDDLVVKKKLSRR